ncbi:unnamed protein product, partial [Prorocentrum cordatum]
ATDEAASKAAKKAANEAAAESTHQAANRYTFSDCRRKSRRQPRAQLRDMDQAAVAGALQSADVAELLTSVDKQRLAAAVVAKSTVGELSPPGQACQACPHGQLCYAQAVAACVLDADGLREYTHVPVRCRAAGRAARGRCQWANFVPIKKVAHRYSRARKEWPDHFMPSPTFGINQTWLQQFPRRLAHQHTSFWREAEVHWWPGSGMSKKRMHMKLMKAWYLMRLLTHLAEIKGGQRERWCARHAGLLDKPALFEGRELYEWFPALLGGCWGAAQSTLVARAAAAAKEKAAGAPGEVEPKVPVPSLRLRKRKAPAELHLATLGPSAAAAAPQESDPAARADSAPARPRKRRRMACPAPSCSEGDATRAALARPAQTPADAPGAPLAEDATLRELQEISCKTHKSYAKGGKCGQLEPFSLAVRRTGWFLVACSPAGHIVDAQEFYGVESLAQRYCFLVELKQRLPGSSVVIHDDACHLRKYCTN